MAKHFKRTIIHDYFDSIDTPTKAYLLGFFAADGTIELNQCNHYTLRVVQKISDGDIIRLFQSEISPNSKIEVCREKYNRISIVSQPIGEALTKLGFPVRKTYVDYGLPNIDERLMRDFIRGYFDGDGTANTYIIKNKICRQVSMTGNCLQFFDEMAKYLRSQHIACYQGTYLGGGHKKGAFYHHLRITGYEQWYAYLYPGITAFPRKQIGCSHCMLTSSELRHLKEFWPRRA